MAKTIVITLPKGLGDGNKMAVPALQTASIASRQLDSLLAAGNFGNLVHIIKDEPPQGFQTQGFLEEEVVVGGEDKPPTRKRQRLDHLSMEEKIMRRWGIEGIIIRREWKLRKERIRSRGWCFLVVAEEESRADEGRFCAWQLRMTGPLPGISISPLIWSHFCGLDTCTHLFREKMWIFKVFSRK